MDFEKGAHSITGGLELVPMPSLTEIWRTMEEKVQGEEMTWN